MNKEIEKLKADVIRDVCGDDDSLSADYARDVATEVLDAMASRMLEGNVLVPVELISAVAHIGVDFGYGEFALDEEHIKQAQDILSVAQYKGDL